MSGNKLGMQVEEVTRLAGKLRTSSDELTGIVTDISNQLENTDWKGPDRNRFHSDWMGRHRTDLASVAAALEQFGVVADKNATQQQDASN